MIHQGIYIIYPIRPWNSEARPGEKSGRAKNHKSTSL